MLVVQTCILKINYQGAIVVSVFLNRCRRFHLFVPRKENTSTFFLLFCNYLFVKYSERENNLFMLLVCNFIMTQESGLWSITMYFWIHGQSEMSNWSLMWTTDSTDKSVKNVMQSVKTTSLRCFKWSVWSTLQEQKMCILRDADPELGHSQYIHQVACQFIDCC